MNNILNKIAEKFWPEINSLSKPRRMIATGDVITSLYSTLIFLFGIQYLIIHTDFQLLIEQLPMLFLFSAIILIFTKFSFFIIIEFRADRYGSADGAFNSMGVWMATFIIGIHAIWIMVIITFINYLLALPGLNSTSAKWNNYRSMSLSMAGFTVPFIIGISYYQKIGGTIPIENLFIETIWFGTIAILINYFIFILIWFPYFLFGLNTQISLTSKKETKPIFSFFMLAVSLPTFAHPFAIIGAALLSMGGLTALNFFTIGLIVVAWLARKFSSIAENNRQQSSQLLKLEQLSRALLNSPPELNALSPILEEYIPNMFPSGFISIWLNPGQTIYHAPDNWGMDKRKIWDFTSEINLAHSFTTKDPLPWDKDLPFHRPAICAPILAQQGGEVIGGIYIELRRLAQRWSHETMEALFPAIYSLCDQIASAVNQAEKYAQTIALQKVGQEIQIAGQIQASFLPNKFPNIPGWQLAVTLEPASGGLSGDFFDFIPLSRGRLGIVIADVADKGLGAALYMALTRTLIRTYAFEYHSRPDLVFSETNERVLNDARANLFITAFYGVLDPVKGTLLYVNAGHNPPLFICNDEEKSINQLTRTGMPIGIEEDERWRVESITFNPGDKLVLYTDGIPEAENEEGQFFNDSRLIDAVLDQVSGSSYEVQSNILEKVKIFRGDMPPTDDITLMVIGKEPIS
jgi:serine phosphatase RsbU (regulator of sigma subunit)